MTGCCRCQTFLIVLQLCLGAATTGLCVYLYLFVPALSTRDKPFWAGVPVLCAGLSATSFIGGRKSSHGRLATCSFVFKILSVIFAVISIFTCVTSSVFTALQLHKLFSFSHCQHVTDGCLCFHHVNQTSSNMEDGGHLYRHVTDCHMLFCEIKIYLCSVGGLCAVCSIVAISFITAVWNSAYGGTSASAPVTSSSTLSTSRTVVSSSPRDDHLL